MLAAGLATFERGGWPGTTTASVAAAAGVSPKTVAAIFGTKANLLAATVTYAFRGEDEDVPIRAREEAQRVERAPDAGVFVERHSSYAAAINAKTARIALVVDSAAAANPEIAALRDQMRANRAFGARWAAELILAKPGHRPTLELREATDIIGLAIAPSTWRVLTDDLGLDHRSARDRLAGIVSRLLLDERVSAQPKHDQ